MKVLSLFDGISCGRLALDKAGIPVERYYASEIDNSAITVSKNNNPDILHIGDITKLSYKDGVLYTENESYYVGTIDMVIGGSPCQGFSNAGYGMGFEDPRSSLFFHMIRIIGEVKPRYRLLENVKMKSEWLNTISGYMKCTPVFIDSSLVSAQSRQRYYWANWAIKEPEDKNICLSDILENGYTDRRKSYCIDANYGKGSNLKSYAKGRRQIIFYSMEDMEWFKNNKKTCGTLDVPFRLLTVSECEKLQTLPVGYIGNNVSKVNGYKCIGNGWTVDVIAHIFNELKKSM